jgi:hypothetical protein
VCNLNFLSGPRWPPFPDKSNSHLQEEGRIVDQYFLKWNYLIVSPKFCGVPQKKRKRECGKTTIRKIISHRENTMGYNITFGVLIEEEEEKYSECIGEKNGREKIG